MDMHKAQRFVESHGHHAHIQTRLVIGIAATYRDSDGDEVEFTALEYAETPRQVRAALGY